MPLRLVELRADEPSIEVRDRYLLILDPRAEEVAAESEIRQAIRHLFDLASTLTSVGRQQVFESDAGELLEIEQMDEQSLISVRAIH